MRLFLQAFLIPTLLLHPGACLDSKDKQVCSRMNSYNHIQVWTDTRIYNQEDCEENLDIELFPPSKSHIRRIKKQRRKTITIKRKRRQISFPPRKSKSLTHASENKYFKKEEKRTKSIQPLHYITHQQQYPVKRLYNLIQKKSSYGVKEMLKKKPPLNELGGSYGTGLHLAVAPRYMRGVKLLVEGGAKN